MNGISNVLEESREASAAVVITFIVSKLKNYG